MKANKFLSKLLENWPAKIICFTIAVFLYLFYQLSQVETFNVNIPLTVINEGNVELVSTQGNITNVKVVVKAKNNTVSHSQ
ncbi:MAG: hypothetical protein HUK25_07190, partial [Treponema sp.]|nr:hypothetical protein [Treponema sp.]